MPSLSVLIFLLICLVNTNNVFAEQTTIAVAANFTATMKALVDEFQVNSGYRVNAAYGASGKFVAQIQHGAPFDAFLSADQAKPQLLEQNGAAVVGSRFTYAIGQLVLWSSHAGYIDQNATRLKQNQFNKLALANPKLAPYGLAAIETLTRLNLVTATKAKWVQGENISQTYQFVSTGNAKLGFISLSQLRANSTSLANTEPVTGSHWLVPNHLYAPIKQDAVLLKRGEQNAATLAFINFIQGKKAQGIISRYGYTLDTPVKSTKLNKDVF